MAVKRNRGGKYSGATFANGYFGRNDAGTPREFKGATAGTQREFIGSGTQEYTFFSKTRGALTIRANSFEEAWRLAKLRGYNKRNYKKR